MAFATADSFRFWCEGFIPFEVGDDILIDDEAQAILNEGIDAWNRAMPLQVRGRLGERDYVFFTKHSTRCSSPVGKQGRAQRVGCPIGGAGLFDPPAVMHEIGHAAGLLHEQCRPDRDSFVTINWENIEAGREHNFCPTRRAGQMIGDYERESLMHYPHDAFSTGGDTIVPVEPGAALGGDTPTAGDIEAVAQLCVSVPDVREFSLLAAADRIREAHLKPKWTGSPTADHWVHGQSPDAGRTVGRGATVSLNLRRRPRL